MIAVGSTVRYHGEVGTVRSFVNVGDRRRARVIWTDATEQYVDADKLAEVTMPAGPELPTVLELGGEG